MVMGLVLTADGVMAALFGLRTGVKMLKLILSLLMALPSLERDVEGVVNEIKDAPDGASAIRNSITALRKLADDLEAAL